MSRPVAGLSPQHPITCAGCAAAIWFAVTTANHKLMPLDVTPNAEGNVAVSRDVQGSYWARVLGNDKSLTAGMEKLYMPHFATCPERGKFSKQVHRETERLAPVIDIRTRRRVDAPARDAQPESGTLFDQQRPPQTPAQGLSGPAFLAAMKSARSARKAELRRPRPRVQQWAGVRKAADR